MAESIVFDTGVKTYDVNGNADISFNPTSGAFIEKMQNTASELNAIHETFVKGTETDGSNAYKLLRDADEQMRGVLDAAFGDGFCKAVCPKDKMYLLDIANGFPLWANLMLAILDKMDDSLASEKTVAQTRIRKYSAKYKK